MTEIADALDAAADVLERDGWTQGDLHNYATGGHCALGAIDVATGARENADLFGLYLAAAKALVDYVGRSVMRWNDTPGRTATEVVEAMRTAALLLRTKARVLAEATA